MRISTNEKSTNLMEMLISAYDLVQNLCGVGENL